MLVIKIYFFIDVEVPYWLNSDYLTFGSSGMYVYSSVLHCHSGRAQFFKEPDMYSLSQLQVNEE